MLQLARERKGVDLFRAERDTKIRLKYLAALEDSHFEDLPAAVYTKGFLRNYAIYLALDPEEVLQRWRDELTPVRGRRSADKPLVAPPPRPIVTPRRGLTVSTGWLMAILVLAAVLGFVGYIGMQMMRFLETPVVGLTDPPSLVSTVNAEDIMLAGTSDPGALITVTAAGQMLHTSADQAGRWSLEVPLAPGRNDLQVVADDPVTGQKSAPINVIVSVPLGDGTPAPSAGAGEPVLLRLTLLEPAQGSTLEDGGLTVRGTTTGARVNISAEPVTSAEASPAAPSPDNSPDASPAALPSPSAASSVDLEVASGGSFSHGLDLAPGEWLIVVTAFSSGLQPVSQTRRVTVDAADELVLVITAVRNDSWLRVVTDGTMVRGWDGPTLPRGSSITVTAQSEIWLRTGNAGAVSVTLNGVELGRLGRNGVVGNWIFRPGADPERTSETR
ncbi:MAG TPA: RodZ domain-containing protein [Candidatus Limnocylindria bacterium]|nr:RodZ domain-containing protein [Candidatus Limnocylindria bacterium]